MAGSKRQGQETWDRIKLLAPAAPYLAVAVGLWGLRNAWAAILLYHALMLLCLGLSGYLKNLGELGRGWNGRWGLWAGVGGALGGAMLYGLWPYLGIEMDWTRIGLESSLGLFVLYFCTINPCLEELFWRGYLAEPGPLPQTCDLWFAGYHLMVLPLWLGWGWLPLTLMVLVLAAWLWRQLRYRLGGLAIPLLSHTIADVSVLGAVLLRG